MTQEVRRARRAGVETVWRLMENLDDDRRFVTQIYPFMTDADAESSLSHLPDHWFVKPLVRTSIKSEGIVEGMRPPGLAHSLFYEVETDGPNGSRTERLISGTVEEILLIMNFSGPTGSWTWDDALSIVEMQTQRIDRVLLEYSTD